MCWEECCVSLKSGLCTANSLIVLRILLESALITSSLLESSPILYKSLFQCETVASMGGPILSIESKSIRLWPSRRTGSAVMKDRYLRAGIAMFIFINIVVSYSMNLSQSSCIIQI